ncbi:MAG TPA: PDZ domain-containing protein [Planctomycetota bacterium]|jgi:membrane-associated protease RseP (regulator of RpoE activity)
MFNKKQLAAITFVAALALFGVVRIHAADSKPTITPEMTTNKEKDLEARIQALEKRVQELEAQPRTEPGVGDLGQWRDRHDFGPEFDDFFNRMQREMHGRGLGMGPMGQMPGMGMVQKPRMGVELAPPSDELRERFKNDVKDGAFVMDVVPGSPAEKAGLHVGDAITSFNSKAVSGPRDLIDAVRNAPNGKNEVAVERRGEALKLNVELGEAINEGEDTNFEQGPQPGGQWLRRNPTGNRQGAVEQSRTEVKASALELNDDLAKALKLNDEQKKKMTEVLDKHAKALNADVAAREVPQRPQRGMFGFSLKNQDVSRMVADHVKQAEKELTGTLNADQMKQWADYRRSHSSLSVSQSMQIEQNGSGAPEPGSTGF